MADEPPADGGPDEHEAGASRQASEVHDQRHELTIATLLGKDVPDGERAEAVRLLASCPSCVVLHADLLALASATRALPMPARSRDFRLTADDAARLTAFADRDGEPGTAATRLTGEMQVSNPDHPAHDLLWVASLIDRSTSGPERVRAEALIAGCTDCAALHQDLLTLRDAARALPTPPRTREFTITPETASRLQRAGWRRLIAVFGSTRDAFTRPLAIGLTTIGLAGLLVSTVPGLLLQGASTGAAPTLGQAIGDAAGAGANPESIAGSREAPAPSAAPSTPGPAAAALAPSPAAQTAAPAPAAPSIEPVPSGEGFDTFVAGPAASAGAAAIAPPPNASSERQGLDRTTATSIGAEAPSVDRFAVTSVAALLFAIGIGLFVLRWAGRRA